MNQTIHTNQLLTNFATGYVLKNPVADFVAPPFKVMRSADKYVEYTKSQFRVFDGKVKGREPAKEIQWDLSEGSYQCERYKMAYFVSDVLARNSDKPINLETDAVRQLKMSMAIAREYRVASIAASATFITNTVNAGGDWDTVASGTPVADILTGMASIESANGGYAGNAIVIPTDVGLSMITTTEWKSFFQYTDSGYRDGLFSAVSGLKQLGLDPMLTGAKGLSTAKLAGSDPTVTNLWSDSVLVFYREVNPSLQSRTLMYSPYVEKDIVQRIVKEEEDGVKIVMTEEIDELLVDATCGYLITNTL
jgi:hypothetical protein